MLRTTLSKLKKACSSLSLAPRALRGDTRYTPGKFQKLSITVLRKAEKSTKSGKDKDPECERCNKLIELIFGPSKPPNTIQGITKTELPDSDLHHISEQHKDKLAETIVPQVPEAPDAQCEKADRVLSESYGKGDDGKKQVLENVSDVPMDFQLHETTAKQTEEQLAQKLEIINETPMVEAEKPAIDGFNAPPRVLGNFDSRKFDDFEDIRIQRTAAINEAETFGEDNMKNTIESLVRRIEETRRLEEVHRLEEVRRIELLLSNEIERSDFKLPILNFSSDRQNRKSGASAETHHPYDELAKRCLDAPSSKIDERLLKEMEKLGVPQTSPRGESSVIEENIIQIDLKKPRKPVKKTEIDLETREFERDPPIAYVDKLHPAFQMANSPKTISEDETDSATLSTERIQLYELDKKPLKYSEYTETAQEPVEMDAYEDSSTLEPRTNYDFSQTIIDPYDKKTIAFDNDGEECDPLWFEKYMIRQELIEQAKTDERLDGATETSEVESDEANATAQSITANQAVQCPNESESPLDQPKKDPEPYIAFESQTLEHASENWQFSEQPESISDTYIPKERASEPLQATSQPVTAETSTNHETIQLSIQIDPIEPVRSEEAAEHTSETYHYISQHEPVETLQTNAEKNNETFEYLSQSEIATSETNAPKHDSESYQFMTQPEPTSTLETSSVKEENATFGFDSPEPTMPTETNTETRTETFQYSTPPEPAESSRASSMEQDVTYIEPSAEEVSTETTQQNNPNITPEQISHSFVQPQTMVNPLVDSRTLTDPADEIQKTMSAACGPLPKIKSDEEISLSEMLKRVRMRNRMEFCQAYDRQVDPVTGKCGKKTPPCPPPAPKCPQCPPPPCPPPPPPCPRPCKPACPPPCPPPCPAKKNPCQKFKKHFPGFNLKNIITLLLQPESEMQKTFYVQISERSNAVLAPEMSLKLQEIGLNLLVAYPRKVPDGMTSNFKAENLTLARNYEPWVPIPSWPIPKKEEKRPFVCPKEGCKLLPPPKLRPPCNENPCINFPKRSNSFSIANLFSFAFGDYVVFDIMD